MAKKYRYIKQLAFILLFLVLLVFVLVEAREFLYPIFIAILFSYLLYPVVSKLEDWGVPRILANLLTIIFSMAVAIGLVVLLYQQLSAFLTDFPNLEQKVMQNLDKLQREIDDEFGEYSMQNEHWLRQQVGSALAFSGGFLRNVLMATADTLVKFGLMPVYIFLMLYYRNKFEDFLLRLLPAYRHPQAERIINDISQVTKHYMGGIVTVVLILCVLNTTGLFLIGVEYAVLLGILSALMNFIPYFGTLIGGAIPLLYTFVVMGSPSKALLVLIFFLLVQFTENNILTPNITGGRVNINPLFTILSIIVGGMIWGVPGMFVAVPYLAMFKIYCDHHKALNAYSFLLGTEGTEEHAITLDKIKRMLGLKKNSPNRLSS
ncbi:AI-2E family transporter [Pontibacter ummariensis]|nr:AI-2E family transporter [Pontibacter ummariensis]